MQGAEGSRNTEGEGAGALGSGRKQNHRGAGQAGAQGCREETGTLRLGEKAETLGWYGAVGEVRQDHKMVGGGGGGVGGSGEARMGFPTPKQQAGKLSVVPRGVCSGEAGLGGQVQRRYMSE